LAKGRIGHANPLLDFHVKAVVYCKGRAKMFIVGDIMQEYLAILNVKSISWSGPQLISLAHLRCSSSSERDHGTGFSFFKVEHKTKSCKQLHDKPKDTPQLIWHVCSLWPMEWPGHQPTQQTLQVYQIRQEYAGIQPVDQSRHGDGAKYLPLIHVNPYHVHTGGGQLHG
jgi:hypothetical protein